MKKENSRLGLGILGSQLSNSHSPFPIRKSIWEKLNARPKRSQSEMVGFVLIVVVVVVAAMVFLIISLKQDSGDIPESVEVENLVSVVLDYTSECAIVFEPNYDSVKDLIVSCADNDICSNLDKSACDVLNSTLVEIISGMMETESTVSAYQIDIYEKDGEAIIPKIFSGSCTGQALGGLAAIPGPGSKDLILKITLCKSDI